MRRIVGPPETVWFPARSLMGSRSTRGRGDGRPTRMATFLGPGNATVDKVDSGANCVGSDVGEKKRGTELVSAPHLCSS